MSLNARSARPMLALLVCVALMATALWAQFPVYADGVVVATSTFRIGLHHGVNSLSAASLRYAGQVRFYMADFLEHRAEIAVDDAGAWRVEREAVRLQVGPFITLTEAEGAGARWPVTLSPSFVVREGGNFFAVGGLFFTVEQAEQGLPLLAQAGLHGQVRGQMFLATESFFSQAEAELLRERLSAVGLESRLFFDGNFRVAAGRARDESELNFWRERLATTIPEVAWSTVPPDSQRLEVIRHDGRQLFVFANLPRRALRVEIVQGQDAAMSIEGRMHRGIFEFAVNSAHRMLVIGIMDVDDYLKGVVPREMPASWPLEALKAQAVVARTYAYANRNRHAADNFDLCTLSTCCQAYGGVAWEHPNSNRAVDETRGVIIFFNGRPASTFYHSDSGGHTESVENVWGGSPQLFLVGAPDPFPALAGSTHTSWHAEITQQAIQSIVRHNRGDVGTVLSISIARRFASGRVAELVITGTRGTVTYTRQQARLFDGTPGLFALRSTMYNVSANTAPLFVHNGQSVHRVASLQNAHMATASGQHVLPVREQHVVEGSMGSIVVNAVPTSFVFSGSGWGHGVGMSQWGARGMAERGHTFRDILLHYYSGVDLITLVY